MAEEKIKGRWWDITLPADTEHIQAARHPWSMQDHGYFLIKVNHTTKEIGVAYCTAADHTIRKVITGRHYAEIYYTLCRLNLIQQPEHLCYVGSELTKAFIALQYGLVYVQDDELDFSKKDPAASSTSA